MGNVSRNDRSAQNFDGGAVPNGSAINYMLASPASSAPTIRIYQGDRMVLVPMLQCDWRRHFLRQVDDGVALLAE